MPVLISPNIWPAKLMGAKAGVLLAGPAFRVRFWLFFPPPFIYWATMARSSGWLWKKCITQALPNGFFSARPSKGWSRFFSLK